MNSKRLQGYRDLAMSVFVSIVGDGRTAQIFTRNTAILDLLARLEIAQEALEYLSRRPPRGQAFIFYGHDNSAGPWDVAKEALAKINSEEPVV